MEFLKHTLPNGLQIVAECNGQAWSTAVGFFVRTGARDETDDIAGVSHFLEHMMFKGTPSRSADDEASPISGTGRLQLRACESVPAWVSAPI